MKTTILICLATALVACGAKQNATGAAQASPTTTTANAGLKLPPDHPPISPAAAANAAAANAAGGSAAGGVPSAAPAPAANLTGKVLESMNAAGYTYMKLQTASGEVWAAVPQTNVKKGDNVALNAQMTMEKFESKTLNRKFDKLVFATVAGPGAAASAALPGMMGGMGNAPSDHMAAPAAGPIKVQKAEGGRTVAELWSSRASLKDAPVVVRGKVVKSLSGIMGKNWIHVRDGSGANGTDDLTVTTNDTAAVGDVVLVKGILRVDKDFGAGYRYPVIIEDAKLSK